MEPVKNSPKIFNDLSSEDLLGRVAETELSLDDLRVNIELVKNYEEKSRIGGQVTSIALKDHNSILIATLFKGLSVFENDIQVYTGPLPGKQRSLFDTTYYPPLNCYFMASFSQLFRKDINDKPAYLFLNIWCGGRFGACLRHSNINERLFVNKDRHNISVVNPQTKKVEILMKKTVGDSIEDFKVFGKNENGVVSITSNGYIVLYNVACDHKNGEVAHQRVELI